MFVAAFLRLGPPVALLAGVLYARYGGIGDAVSAALGVSPVYAGKILSGLAWVAGAVTVIRAVNVLVWERLRRRTSGKPPPRLLVQLGSLIIGFLAVLGISTHVLDYSVTGLVATSSVIGLVIGFAARSLIADTFSGIAMNLDNAFRIGDFVKVIRPPGMVKLVGRVQEVHWRTTRILTPENGLLVIPNSILAESVIFNMSQPDLASEFEHLIVLDFEVPMERALRVLTAAGQAAAADNAAIFDVKVRVNQISADGVHYMVKYMLDPVVLAPGKAKHAVLMNVYRHLDQAGIAPAMPRQESFEAQAPVRAMDDASRAERLLHHVDLFRPLSLDDFQLLAREMKPRAFRAGQTLITAGQPGSSMFVLCEGLVGVRIRWEGQEKEVARLAPGDFFGEMSLLTGEPRSASVVALADTVAYEIEKGAMQLVLDGNPAVAEALSHAAAERRLRSQQSRETKPPEELAEEHASLAGQILAKMGTIFGRKRKPALT
ncbi:MAG TPA: mechanosensitive ion channel family protein [Azospirillaceae bacterium]|nr:mechanosensitive ion channel family protein [Azospirillaceae bacterium]